VQASRRRVHPRACPRSETYPIHVIFGEQGELRAIFYAQTVIDALAWAEKNATTRRGYAAHIGVHYDEASRQYKR
jgi:hypothetical protein